MAQIDYTKPYVSKDEYLESKGVDLAIELQDDDNKSNKVNRFIRDLTDFVIDFLVNEYACNELNLIIHEFSELAEFRRKRFHLGMLDQIEYVLNNGLIHMDSGINKETGAIIDYSGLYIGSSALRQFQLGAFCNLQNGNVSFSSGSGGGGSAPQVDAYTKSETNALLDTKVDKVAGKGLSSNDYTLPEKGKLATIEAGAEKNVIEKISYAGTLLPISHKQVAIPAPDLSGKEDISNKVTSLSNQSTDTQYPSAKVVWDGLANVRAVAEGKCKSYTIALSNNASFNTQDASISGVSSIVDISGNTIAISSLSQGDVILVVDVDVPDRWFSSSDSKFYILETAKVDLTAYGALAGTNDWTGTNTFEGDLKFKGIGVSTVGQITTTSNSVKIGYGGVNHISIDANSFYTNVADYDLGSSSRKWRNLYLSGKINPGALLAGLVIPDTSWWTTDKTIATTDDVKQVADQLSDEYDNTSTYALGDLVIHDNKLYKCTTTITTAESWDSTHWTATTIKNEVYTKTQANSNFVDINTNGQTVYGSKIYADGLTSKKVEIRESLRPVQDNLRNVGASDRRFVDVCMTGKLTDGTNQASIIDLANLIAYAKGQGWIS